MPKITIDNKEIHFENGMTVLQACELAGVEIPRFCYHEKLSIAGNCRMCLVEMEKSPKPIASCAMPAGDGMIIKTTTDLVKKARKGVMEFLLINHPLDCPICDQGGECDLQDQALYYGFDKSRYEENKRAVNNKYMGPLVSTIMTRCIHCTRCVRFSTEVAGVDDLGLLGRGENAEITTYLQKTIQSELSGNVIDLCPVGALTNKPYAFKSRPWELKNTETYDVFDGLGSSIRVDTMGKKVFRVLPRINEEINEEWISDKTRFAIDGLSRQRLDKVFIKKESKLIEENWDSALSLIKDELNKRGKENTITLSGKFTDIETLFAAKLFSKSLGSKYYDCRYDNAQFVLGSQDSYMFNSSIQEIDNADAILLVGSNPRWEASVLNSRIRKAYINNDCKIGIIGKKINLNYKYYQISENLNSLNEILNEKNDFSKILLKAKNPMIVIGTSAINFNKGQEVLEVCAEIAKKLPNANSNFNPLNILNQDISRVGALEINFYNSAFNGDYANAISKKIKETKPVVFLLGLDEIEPKILKDSFIVYMGHHGDKLASFADIVLPIPAYTEKSSTYMNIEGRVIQTSRCHNPLGEAKEEWKIFRVLSDFFGKEIKCNNLKDLREMLIKSYNQFERLLELPKKNMISFGSKKLISDKKINYNIKNFYMNDSISRASETMAKCTKEILEKVA
ncbi:MAG: NADH-quinone oxidoreductase chain 3 [Alphaproteobacteria bacterium MarineAlpha5_Bin4]|nr:MAG: NADH-quinone oxidoreductase chain 3 [Alphaproteobacteria bacterium MarineAlpha5_Bin4]|tara:strand:+ start:218 stop:2260 length:2043 start_codon:yes stop_codon:yes gene_type:complete